MSDWIDAEVRLPDEDNRYLVHCPSADPDKPLIAIAWYNPNPGQWSLLPSPWIAAIRHWQPLPASARLTITNGNSRAASGLPGHR